MVRDTVNNNVRSVLVVWLLGLTVPLLAHAQLERQPVRPVFGVVWDAPGSLEHATSDLLEMHEIGVEAIRTRGILDSVLLSLTDSLGLAVYHDLGPKYAPARRLEEQQTTLEREVAEAVDRAAGHTSALHFGLGDGIDTSDSRTCEVLARLVSIVKRRLPVSQTYYVTHFLEDDACGDVVDLRMTDRFLSARLVSMLVDRRDVTQFDGMGVGSLAFGRDPQAGSGLSRPLSAESQARKLEEALTQFASETSVHRPAVFVYRWRDIRDASLRTSLVPDRFGLKDSAGATLPAYNVVRGFSSETEQAFAFPAGDSGIPNTWWLVVLCWCAIGTVTAFYAGSPTFRQVVYRYFAAHGFFREAVSEGRDVLPLANLVLLGVASIMIGIVVAAILTVAVRSQTMMVVASWLPRSLHDFLSVLIASPWLLVLFVACAHAFWHTVWTSALSLGSRAGRVVLPTQTLMLVVWPLWGIVCWGVVGTVIPTLAAGTVARVVPWLIAAIVATYAMAAVRTSIDYRKVARLPLYVSLPLSLLSPFGILVVWQLAMLATRGPELGYLWHLMLRQ